jgi:hypothetical protein
MSEHHDEEAAAEEPAQGGLSVLSYLDHHVEST